MISSAIVSHIWPGPEARVVELGDQRLDLVALVAEERGLGGGEEREALDPLRRPLGAQLGRRDAPHLLGVGLEEVLVEPLAEAVGDPLLEVVLAPLRLDGRPQVGHAGEEQLDRAELADDVHALQRIVEELAVPVDPRHARALEELLPHHLVPEGVDLLGLGEEAVPAEVEAVAVAHLGLGQAADLVLGLEHDHGPALTGEQVARGQPGGTAAEHGDGLAGVFADDPEAPRRFELDSRHGEHLAPHRGGSFRFLKTANRP